MTELENLGAARLYDEIKAGNPALPLLKDFLKDYRMATFELFSGAISAAIALIRKAESVGVVFDVGGQPIANSSELAVDFTRAFAERDLLRVCDLVRLVASCVDGLRGAGCVFCDVPEKQPEQPHVLVEIVSSPARETTTTIKRDADGEIEAIANVQRDFAEHQM